MHYLQYHTFQFCTDPETVVSNLKYFSIFATKSATDSVKIGFQGF